MREGRGVECHVDAGGEDRIDEAEGVADHQPAGAGDLVHLVRVVGLDPPGSRPRGVPHRVRERAVPVDEAVEELLRRPTRLLEVGLVRHDPDRVDAVAQRDLPPPRALEPEEMEDHEPLEARGRVLDVLEPRPDGVLVEVGVLLLDLQLLGQQAPAARGVDHDLREQVLLPPFGHLDPNPDRPIALEQHVLHVHALEHLGAELVHVAEQERVEDVTLDVVAVLLYGVRGREVGGSDRHEGPQFRAGRGPTDAFLVHEPGVLHLRKEPEPVEDEVVRGHHRLADVIPGMDVAFEDQRPMPALCEQAAERRPRGTPTDDDHVGRHRSLLRHRSLASFLLSSEPRGTTRSIHS